MLEDLRGRQLMLCDVIYQEGSKISGWNDYINFVYKDLVTGKKELHTIENPTYNIYSVKESCRTFRKPRHYIEIEKTNSIEIKYKDRFREIAKIAGPMEMRYYKEHTKKKERQQLYKYPYVLGADIPIETYYRVKWERELGNDLKKDPTILFLDIEVNQKHWTGGSIPRKGECPIDAVSIVDDCTNTVHTFLLKVPDNPQIDEFIGRQKELQETLHDMFDDVYGTLTYNIYMFEDELEMLKKVFALIHMLKRDFCLIWNMSFDIPYIIGRLEKLGVDPSDIMCHSDFPLKTLYFYEDKNTFDFDKKRDYFDIACYTHFIDQMIMYASLRKSQGALRRVNLGAIGRREIGDSKLDYTDAGNFVEFSYNDYFKYVIYNIKDTLLQMGINRKCKDLFTFYNSCYNSYCQYKDGLKQTVSLRAFFYREFLEKNIILGNNANFDNGQYKEKKYDPDTGEEIEDDDSFEGAINGDPKHNSHTGLILFGKRSMYLYGACIDFDFSAMYPNSIVSFNIFATCMLGKLYIENGEKFLRYDQDPGKEFVEDMIANDVLFVGNKWFNLPDFDTLNKIVASELNMPIIGGKRADQRILFAA